MRVCSTAVWGQGGARLPRGCTVERRPCPAWSSTQTSCHSLNVTCPITIMTPRLYDNVQLELTAEQHLPSSLGSAYLPAPAFLSHRSKWDSSPRNRAINLPVSPASSSAHSRANSHQPSRPGTPSLLPRRLPASHAEVDGSPDDCSPPPPYQQSSFPVTWSPRPESPLLSPTPFHAQPCFNRIAERRLVLANSPLSVPMSSTSGMKRKVVILGSPSVGECSVSCPRGACVQRVWACAVDGRAYHPAEQLCPRQA